MCGVAPLMVWCLRGAVRTFWRRVPWAGELLQPVSNEGAGRQVDGPSHYARASRIALGSTEMKRRQLKAVGYRLCSVAFWDWPSGSSTDDKERVLRSVLSPHVQVLALPAPLVVLLPVKSDGSV